MSTSAPAILHSGFDAPAPSGFDAPAPSGFDAPAPTGFDPSLPFDAPEPGGWDAPAPGSFSDPSDPVSSGFGLMDAPAPPSGGAAHTPSGFDSSPYGGSSFDASPSSFNQLPPPPAKAPRRASAPLTADGAFTRSGPAALRDRHAISLSKIPGASAFKAVPFEGRAAKILMGVLAAVAIIAMVAVGLSKMGGTGTAAVTTTTEPVAPPIGAFTFGSKSATTAGPAAGGWVNYRSPDGTFAVEFPSAPRTEARYVGIGGVNVPDLFVFVEIGVKGQGYTLEALDLPSTTLFSDTQDAFDRLNADPNGPASGMTATANVEVNGSPGIRFDADDNGTPVRGLLVVKANRVYIASVVGQTDAGADRFLMSLRPLADPELRN